MLELIIFIAFIITLYIIFSDKHVDFSENDGSKCSCDTHFFCNYCEDKRKKLLN